VKFVAGLMACSLIVLLSGAGSAQDADASSEATDLAVYGWFADLAGSCWRAEFPGGETRDRQCHSAQFGKVLRVDQVVETLAEGRVVSALTASSVYAWDARNKRIRHFFWGSDGSLETATGWLEGGDFVLVLDREMGPDGKYELRTVLRREGRDGFSAAREQRAGSGWSPLFSVSYQREQSGSKPVGAP
jgi:hypothetical protein